MNSPSQIVARFLSESGDPGVKMTMKTVVFSAIFLDDASHRELLAWWEQATGTPLLSKHFAHHMTIKFKPSPEEVEQLDLGKKVRVRVIGWAADEKGQAVLVDSDVESTNAKPHITVSTNGGSPAYSNTLLSAGSTRIAGPTLEGVIDTFPRE